MSNYANPKAVEESVKQAFGVGSYEVVAPLGEITETFSWLEELFKSILEAANEKKPLSGFVIGALADAGAHLAFEHRNSSGYRYKEMLGKLKEAGLL